VQFVRTEAVARNVAVRLSFHDSPGGTCWVVHTGAAGQCACDAEGAAACAGDAVALKSFRLPAAGRIGVQSNVASIRFEPLHGVATPAGTLKVVAASGRAVHHVVNIAGRVRSCTPSVAAPPVPGYRPC
jgi:type IV fimbrial biogenesis protein FimT